LPKEPVCPTLADVFAVCEAHLAPALLDPEGRRAVRHVAAAVPAVLSTFWGLEIRLGERQARADILWEVRRDTPGAALLAGQGTEPEATAALDALVAASPVWRSLRRFASRWQNDTDPARAIGNIWLEADTATAETGAALEAQLHRPCLFWGADPNVADSSKELLSALPGLARDTFGLELDAARIAGPIRALPPDADIFQTGVMGGRSGTVVRLCVRNIVAPDAARWLAAIGWPGHVPAVADLLGDFAPLLASVALDVDVTPDGIGPKLGLEFYRPFETVDPGQWQPVFEKLAAFGLALPDKLAGLSGFAGRQRFDQRDAILGRSARIGFPVIARNIHHLKLVVIGAVPVEAKAYLGIYRPGVDYRGIVGSAPGDGRDPWLLV
jgi:hypothetical protein